MPVITINGNMTTTSPIANDIQTLTSLGSLSDVTFTTLSDGELIRYNNTSKKFENVTVDEIAADLTEIDGGTY